MSASQDISSSIISAPDVLKDSSTIFINVSAELNAEPTKSTTSSLKNVNVPKVTTSLTVHAHAAKKNKPTTNTPSLATSLHAQESTNSSQPPPKPASVNPDTSESEEPAPTATQDTTTIAILIDVFASQDISKREVSVKQFVLETKNMSMENVNATTEFPFITDNASDQQDVPSMPTSIRSQDAVSAMQVFQLLEEDAAVINTVESMVSLNTDNATAMKDTSTS